MTIGPDGLRDSIAGRRTNLGPCCAEVDECLGLIAVVVVPDIDSRATKVFGNSQPPTGRVSV